MFYERYIIISMLYQMYYYIENYIDKYDCDK